MDSYVTLIVTGIIVGALGTLIGAGGGFLLVPLLILTHHALRPEIITAISMAIVASNAISGTVAYARAGRIDYRAGVLFALFTVPGSILGVYTTQFIPKFFFKVCFGLLLILLAFVLFMKQPRPPMKKIDAGKLKKWKHHTLTDKKGTTYSYYFNDRKGIFISIIVGYLSPLLGIGGGVIHVPALVQLLNFPIHVATATSHFILAIMSLVSVTVHAIKGNYDDVHVLRMVIGLSTGAIIGAQIGAYLSHKIKGNIIVRALAICLGLVGVRLLLGLLF
jgi:hypothetical protein